MNIKRGALMGIAMVLALVISATSALAAGTKNETVYALLNNDGSVEQIYVVNQLNGAYTDHGDYTEIKNLSTTSQPMIEGDRITFPDRDVEGGLYYQGTMSGELPMLFEIKYSLNGVTVDAGDLSGASGDVQIAIKCSPNPRCHEAVREGLMTQVALSLDMQRASDITAPDSTIVSAGRMANISRIILSGESATIIIKARVSDFHMDPITITLLKGTMSFSGLEETVSEFESGFDDMYTGTDDMVDGTAELKDGMVSLLDGVGGIKKGLKKLETGGAELYGGFTKYRKGFGTYLGGIESLTQPSTDIMLGLGGLSDNGKSLAGSMSAMSDNLSGLYASSQDLKALAESLAGSDDPDVAALADGMLRTLGAIGELSGGLEQTSAGTNEFVAAVEQTAMAYPSFHNGLMEILDSGDRMHTSLDKLVAGFADYNNGVSRLSSGANRLYNSIKGLPDDIQTLIDGQMEFRDGIATAKSDIREKTSVFIADDNPPVSFSSPFKNHPDSIQYIFATSGIKKGEVELEVEEPIVNDDFLTRLAALFK